MCGHASCNTAFLVAALVYQQQLLLRNQLDFPSERDNITNLFLHAGAGEDAALFPQAGGDYLGHGSRVSFVFHLSNASTHMKNITKTPARLCCDGNKSGVLFFVEVGFPNQTVDQEEMLRFCGKSYSCTEGMRLNQIWQQIKDHLNTLPWAMSPQTPGAWPVLFSFIITWNHEVS